MFKNDKLEDDLFCDPFLFLFDFGVLYRVEDTWVYIEGHTTRV